MSGDMSGGACDLGRAGAAARRSPETAGAPVALPGARGWTPARRVLLRGGPWLALALVFAGFSVSSPLFVTFANLGNVLQQSAVTGLLAFGLTIVMIGGGADAIKGGLDLSIAANLGLCAAATATRSRSPRLARRASRSARSMRGRSRGCASRRSSRRWRR
ncbi:sugar ABC transporter permease [Burkholderia pseudomallei]|nr:sugar ABC transporter permease [Burkholderia pseudomallei]CAK0105751.1 sugar ABC transporter permease [Burkholderia pseudomallei]